MSNSSISKPLHTVTATAQRQTPNNGSSTATAQQHACWSLFDVLTHEQHTQQAAAARHMNSCPTAAWNTAQQSTLPMQQKNGSWTCHASAQLTHATKQTHSHCSSQTKAVKGRSPAVHHSQQPVPEPQSLFDTHKATTPAPVDAAFSNTEGPAAAGHLHMTRPHPVAHHTLLACVQQPTHVDDADVQTHAHMRTHNVCV